MLGPQKVRCLDRPAVVSLEMLVPRDHFYRYLDATLDLSFVREWVKDYLLEQCRLDPDRPGSPGYQRSGDWQVSTTDPDAKPMKHTGQRALLGYHDHYVVDGGKDRIILYALVTPADVMENEPMLDLLRRVSFRWHLRPRRAVADTTYGTIENIRASERRGHPRLRAFARLGHAHAVLWSVPVHLRSRAG